MNFIIRMLASYNYSSIAELGQSIAPSSKYNLTIGSLALSVMFPAIDRIFGLDTIAFTALLMVMVTELASGIYASKIRGEAFQSFKLSRFSFKCCIYLVLLFVPYSFSISFKDQGNSLGATVFDWMHLFLLIQIVQENIVSILENLATISGKDKTHWITLIKEKIKSLVS